MVRLEVQLTENQKRIIKCMSDGDIVRPARYTASDAGVTDNLVRTSFRFFREIGLAKYGPLMSEDDGHVAGSGTWLTPLGCEFQLYLFNVDADQLSADI